MKPTNEERREAAAWIRNGAHDIDINGYIKLAINVVDRGDGATWGQLALKLADLIEPEPEQTCHNLSEFQDCDCFTCSNCGESYEMRRLEYDIDEYCTLDDAIKALDYDGCCCDVRYCPNCGAKVVE